MESIEGQIEEKKAGSEADLFHRPDRLMRISTLANILSWVILVIAVIIFGVQLYRLIPQVIQVVGQYGFADIALAFVQPLMILLVGLFFTVILQVLAEGVYLLMDLEENTRKA